LPHINGIVISPTCIGENCTIFHQVTIGEIERDDGSRGAVYIGCGAKILGKTSIGSNVMIAAGAIVIMNVPVGSTVIGVNQIL
jgi:serine O-acetyltransferase